MSIEYNPTPLKLLNFLGCANPAGKAQLEDLEAAHKIKLPSLLFDFFSRAWNQPLFECSDIWVTEEHPSLSFSYDILAEIIAEWQEDWAKDPKQYEGDVCFQLSQLPKERWPERVSNYLEIGSDYSAGVITFGIRLEDLALPDPPVYSLHEADTETDWKLLDETLSLFLMRILADVLTCAMYRSAQEVLEEAGWRYNSTNNLEEALQQAGQLGIDLSKAARCGALYSAAVTPDVCRYCYVADTNTFFLLKEDSGNNKVVGLFLSPNQ